MKDLDTLIATLQKIRSLHGNQKVYIATEDDEFDIVRVYSHHLHNSPLNERYVCIDTVEEEE